ncbi:MAG: hypothetical protein ABIN97_16140 [Ginsengibacter sp.]
MKKISLWAKQHKSIARFLVVTIKLALAFMAYYLGDLFYKSQVHIPLTWVFIAAIISIGAAILYPSKKFNSLSKHQFYVRQKSCDFILAAGSFIIITTIVNNQATIKPSMVLGSIASTIKPARSKARDILASLSYRDKSSLTRVEKRVLKKEFLKQLKIYAIAKVTHDKESANNALPIMLTIIAALGLFVLLASLACSLSCSGSETAAAIVFFLGLAGIIWGTVALIKHINKRQRK